MGCQISSHRMKRRCTTAGFPLFSKGVNHERCCRDEELESETGMKRWMHFPDGTAHKNRMQGNDFVQSVMYRRGVTCFSCHDVHGTANNADLIKPARDLFITCHNPGSPNGPHNVSTIEQHTHHAAGSTGSQCVSCH